MYKDITFEEIRNNKEIATYISMADQSLAPSLGFNTSIIRINKYFL